MISAAPNPNDELPQGPFAPIEKVDIAICTWNRAALLEKTIDSLKRLIVPYQAKLRVILVDNGSTDATQDVLQSFANDEDFNKRHHVLILNESQQGHTHARNKAVDHIDSDLLIWTDDDVLLDAFLVQRYIEFADSNPKVAFFGGKIEPDFEIRQKRGSLKTGTSSKAVSRLAIWATKRFRFRKNNCRMAQTLRFDPTCRNASHSIPNLAGADNRFTVKTNLK